MTAELRQKMLAAHKSGDAATAQAIAGQLFSTAKASGQLRAMRPAESISGIGDRLAEIITRDSGKHTGCSGCRNELNRLNRMTESEVLADIESIAGRIISRGKKAQWKVWLAATILPDYVGEKVFGWIREACEIPEPPKPATVAERREGPTVQFVWTYWHGGARGDELRWSIRSVERFFVGTPEIVVVGDRPPWFRGTVIDQQRIPGSEKQFMVRLLDVIHKMKTISVSDQIRSEFVWMMDDQYFVRDFTRDTLKTPRSIPWTDVERKGQWQIIKRTTMHALRDAGRPTMDFATHAPHWIEKSNLTQILDEFRLTENPMLWELLYGNTFHQDPMPAAPFFRLITHKMSPKQLAVWCATATVISNLDSAWGTSLRDYLGRLLPSRSALETR